MVKTNIYYQAEVTKTENISLKAVEVLGELVTPQGIYASNDGLWNGRFHHYFGRDTAITALLVMEAEGLSKNCGFTPKVLQALNSLAVYQGQKDNPETGEEAGKIPHELITSPKDIDILHQTIKDGGGQQWFVDSDGVLKNWDSLDSTPLWMIVICAAINKGWEMPNETIDQLSKATQWCLKNLDKFGGLAGWLPSQQQPNRKFGGLSNQAWKDSWPAFLQDDGQLPKYPVHDIFSNAAMWAALANSSDLLQNVDKELSNKAALAAKSLKERFNLVKGGFKLETEDFYAEALDGNFNQLKAHSVDVGMVMALTHNGDNVYQKNIIYKLVDRLMSDEFYTEAYGLRTYQKDLTNYIQYDQYHRGPNTFWPFAGVLTALGFAKADYADEATKVLKATLSGLEHFESFVELFLVTDGQADIWKNHHSKHTSTLNQAWSVAAAYYASSYLVKD